MSQSISLPYLSKRTAVLAMVEALPAAVLSLPNGHFLSSASCLSEGHPDKVCDQVADAVVDACLAQDPNSRVTCEVCLKGQVLFVLGDYLTSAQVEIEQIVRETLKRIGLDSEEKGLDYITCRVIVQMTKRPEWTCGGDSGVCIGTASSETPEAVSLPQALAWKLAVRLTEVRRNGLCTWLRTDGRAQITIEYKQDQGKAVPVRVHSVLINAQHDPEISLEELRLQLKEHVVKPVLPAQLLDEHTSYNLNVQGKFIQGREVGVSGRRSALDSFGSQTVSVWAGIDPSQVSRCGSFAARWVAKSIIKSHLCDRVQFQVAYAGKELASVALDSFGTCKVGKDDSELLSLVLRHFDLRPESLVREMKLQRPIYQRSATFSPREDDFDQPWEVPKEVSLDL